VKISRILLISIIIIFCSSRFSFGQIDFEYNGYIYNLPIVQFPSDEFNSLTGDNASNLINLTRLRLKPVIYLANRTRLNIEYEFTALAYNSINTASLDFGNQKNRQLIDLSWDLINEKNFGAVHFIDRLYLRQGFDWGNVIIGRQRISWGTGRIWNPTDLFNPINPATYYKIEKDGADAVSSKISLGDFTDVNVVYNPVNKFQSSNFGARFRTNFNEMDLSFMTGYFDKNKIIGADFAGNLLDAGIRGEGIYSISNVDTVSSFTRYVLGIDYQFTSKLYALIEYQFNGEGKTNLNEYELDRLANGEIINLSKNYTYLMLTYQVSPLLILNLANNANLNDGSGFILCSLAYSASDNLYLNVGSQFTYGDKSSEYWYYPPSIFGQLEYYF